MESQNNYKYAAKLGMELIKENKYRYDKDYHHIENKMKWLNKHIPHSIPKYKSNTRVILGMTPFILSKNVSSYHIAFSKILDSCRDFFLIVTERFTSVMVTVFCLIFVYGES